MFQKFILNSHIFLYLGLPMFQDTSGERNIKLGEQK